MLAGRVNRTEAELTHNASTFVHGTRQYDPVVLNATGVWQGRSVTWSATGKACEMRASLTEGRVFAFRPGASALRSGPLFRPAGEGLRPGPPCPRREQDRGR
ncbi:MULTISPECIES: SSI family serine proteinase inhibitor [Streptomyces]|uniref:SSI family serine proteinase inhibitor n=1 Tax=Streptomyces TaxID=1883 RepID=UPI000A6943E5|nr:SSI family serine proteinase inhibitor [Streptomyces sp. NRRL S-4]